MIKTPASASWWGISIATQRALSGGQVLVEGREKRGLARMLGQDGNQDRQVLNAVDLIDASVGLRADIVLAEQFATEVDQACVFFVQVRCRLAIADYIDDVGLKTIFDSRGFIDGPVIL